MNEYALRLHTLKVAKHYEVICWWGFGVRCINGIYYILVLFLQ